MTEKSLPILKLAELPEGQEVDTFALLAAKDESVTRTGKPYFRVTFRDATREIAFPIWGDSGWADECKEKWSAGTIYKLRVVFKETSFGPQLDIRKIRPANPSDRVDGFDESMCQARSKFEPEKLFAELLRIADQEISSAPLGDLICGMLKAHRETLLRLPAATTIPSGGSPATW